MQRQIQSFGFLSHRRDITIQTRPISLVSAIGHDSCRPEPKYITRMLCRDQLVSLPWLKVWHSGFEAPYKMFRHSNIWYELEPSEAFSPSCCLLNSLIVGWVARLVQKRKAGPQFWSWLDEETCVDNPSAGPAEQATEPSNKVKSCQQLLCSACAWALPAMCQQSFFLQHNKAGNLWLET